MSEGNLFGVALALPVIEARLLEHVQLWVPDYLRDIERQVAVRPDGAPHAVGSLPLFRSFTPTDGRVDKWPENQLPACLFGSPGLDGPPRRDGRGEHEGTFAVGFTVVVSARDDRWTRWLCGIYAAALRLLFIQQGAVQGLPITHVTYTDESYDPLAYSRQRAIMAATVTFAVGVGGLGSARQGPAAPSPTPDGAVPDPGPFPAVEETILEVERSPVD